MGIKDNATLTCWAVIMEEKQERREKGEGKEELSVFAWTSSIPIDPSPVRGIPKFASRHLVQ